LKDRSHGPWCYIGDFNAIMGAHKKKRGQLPSLKRLVMSSKLGQKLVILPTSPLLVFLSLGAMADKVPLAFSFVLIKPFVMRKA